MGNFPNFPYSFFLVGALGGIRTRNHAAYETCALSIELRGLPARRRLTLTGGGPSLLWRPQYGLHYVVVSRDTPIPLPGFRFPAPILDVGNRHTTPCGTVRLNRAERPAEITEAPGGSAGSIWADEIKEAPCRTRVIGVRLSEP